MEQMKVMEVDKKYCDGYEYDDGDGFAEIFYINCANYDIDEFRKKLEILNTYHFAPDACLMDRVIDKPNLLQILINEYYIDVNTAKIASYLARNSMHTTDDKLIKIIQLFIDNGLDIFAHEETCLFACAQSGSVQIMQFFIDNGLDPLKYEQKELLARACFVYKPSQPMIKLLINYGLNVNASNGKALLNVCAGKFTDEDIDIIRFLLEAGANPNMNNGKELYLAIKNGSTSCVVLLLQYGAEMDLLNNSILNTASLSAIDELVLDNGLDPKVLLLINKFDKYIF